MSHWTFSQSIALALLPSLSLKQCSTQSISSETTGCRESMKSEIPSPASRVLSNQPIPPEVSSTCYKRYIGEPTECWRAAYTSSPKSTSPSLHNWWRKNSSISYDPSKNKWETPSNTPISIRKPHSIPSLLLTASIFSLSLQSWSRIVTIQTSAAPSPVAYNLHLYTIPSRFNSQPFSPFSPLLQSLQSPTSFPHPRHSFFTLSQTSPPHHNSFP